MATKPRPHLNPVPLPAARVIVVGTDGSPTAAHAVQRAAALARDTGATLHLVTAYDPHYTAELRRDLESAPEEVRWRVGPGNRAELVLSDAVTALPDAPVEVVTHARPGDAVDILLEVAEEVDADLLVVGNKGMNGLKGYVVPSVPNRIAHKARCDVLIVDTASAA